MAVPDTLSRDSMSRNLTVRSILLESLAVVDEECNKNSELELELDVETVKKAQKKEFCNEREMVGKKSENLVWGVLRTATRLKQRFRWPGWPGAVEKWVGECVACTLGMIQKDEMTGADASVALKVSVSYCGC